MKHMILEAFALCRTMRQFFVDVQLQLNSA